MTAKIFTKWWAARLYICVYCGHCGQRVEVGQRVFMHVGYPKNRILNHATCLEREVAKFQEGEGCIHRSRGK